MSNIALQVDQQRAEGLIGASDAAGILGLDKRRPPIWHWRRLRGLHIDDDLPDSVREAGEWGQALEPVIRGKYALERKARVVVPSHSFVHEDWLRATPDGLIASTGDYPCVVELPPQLGLLHPEHYAGLVQIKCRSAWQIDNWLDGVPIAETIQCRVEMAVCNLPWNDCAVLLGGNQMLIHRIERDLEIEATILRDLRTFRDRVQSGVEPDVDGSDAWREYATRDLREGGVEAVADEDDEEALALWKECRRKRHQLELDEATIKTQLLLKLSAAGATRMRSSFGGISAYKCGARSDWKGYAVSLGGAKKAPAQFVKPSTTWAIRCPWSNDDND